MIKRAFIIEDDQRVQMLYRTIMPALGFHPQCAGTLRAAERLWLDAYPDLVVLDSRLPDGQGKATLAWLDAKDPEVPVVVVSGSEGSEHGIPYSDRIVARFSKPFDLVRFSETIRRFARSPDIANKKANHRAYL